MICLCEVCLPYDWEMVILALSAAVLGADECGWGFTVKQDGRTVFEDSGAHSHDLQSDHGGRSSHTCNTVASLQHDAQIIRAIILTDSTNRLQKAESRTGCPNWHTAMHSFQLQRRLWTYCPGHAQVIGSE